MVSSKNSELNGEIAHSGERGVVFTHLKKRLHVEVLDVDLDDQVEVDVAVDWHGEHAAVEVHLKTRQEHGRSRDTRMRT